MTVSRQWAEALAGVDVVSFDIFDTAIVRGVHRPVDLFPLVGREAGCADPAAFAQARQAAEKMARDRAWQARQAVEVSLTDIYACLPEAWPGMPAIELDRLADSERRCELRACLPRLEIQRLYREAQAQGKRVGFVSDMYLERPLIEAMLARCGYAGYDFLLVSSELGSTKASGGLYTELLQGLALPPARVLHVGDNVEADQAAARRAGLKVWPLKRCNELLPATSVGRRLAIAHAAQEAVGTPSALWRSVWHGLAAARVEHSEDSFWTRLGYTHVGPLLLGFAVWLEQQARADGVSRLYFLARDGHIMLKAHQILVDHGMADTPGHYLFASRRVFNLPAITEVDERACDFLVSGSSRLAVAAFLRRAGIDPAQHDDAIRAAGFADGAEVVRSGQQYGQLRALFRALAPRLLEQAAAERARLAHYLEQEGFFAQAHPAIVDIGWHGSLQASLENIVRGLGATAPLTGYYLGTFAAARARIEQGARQRAYLFACGEPAERLAYVRASVEVFEWLFCAPHGSVLGFVENEAGVSPVFEDNRAEQARLDTAQRMQDGALAFIRDAVSCFPEGQPLPPLDPGLAVSMLGQLLLRPSAEEACHLGNLPHTEGFGNVGSTTAIAVPPGSPLFPPAWLNIARAYRRSFWRAGFRRRLWPDCWARRRPRA